jgi:hypothetical protein
MTASVPIAKLIGPILLVAAAAMLANPKDLRDIAREFLQARALIYVTGVLAMLGGLAIVNGHNLWIVDWPIIITLLGWALLIGGAVRIALPSAVRSIGGAMLEHPAVIRLAGAVWLLIGALLTYEGYRQAI